MSGGDCLFVRAKSLAALEGVVPGWLDVEQKPNCDFFSLTNADDWTPIARQIAAAGLEVIELGFQSGVGAFRFAHWQRGKKTRELQAGYEDEGVWEIVRGTAEPWETTFDHPPAAGERSAGAHGAYYVVVDFYRLAGSSEAPIKKKPAAKKPAAKKPAAKKPAAKKPAAKKPAAKKR